jgi:hypothetical protein
MTLMAVTQSSALRSLPTRMTPLYLSIHVTKKLRVFGRYSLPEEDRGRVRNMLELLSHSFRILKNYAITFPKNPSNQELTSWMIR